MSMPDFNQLSESVAAETNGSAASAPKQAAAGNGVPSQGTSPGAAAGNSTGAPSLQPAPAGDDSRPPSQPGSPSVVSHLRDRGYEIPDDYNDDKFLDEIATLYQRVQSAPSPDELKVYESLRPQVAEYASQREQFLKWQAEQAKAAEAQKESDKPKPVWNPPEVDPHAQELARNGTLKRDEKGMFIADNPYYQSAADNLNRYESYKQKFFRKMEDDPVSFFNELLSPQITETQKQYEARIEELTKRIEQFEQRDQQSQVGATINRYFQENADKIWEIDENGDVIFDGDNPVLKPLGKLYESADKSLLETIKDPLQRHNTVVAMIESSSQLFSPQQQAAGDRQPMFDPYTGEPLNGQQADQTQPAKPSQRQQAQDAMLKRHKRATPTAPPQQQRNEPSPTPRGMVPSFKHIYDETEATVK